MSKKCNPRHNILKWCHLGCVYSVVMSDIIYYKVNISVSYEHNFNFSPYFLYEIFHETPSKNSQNVTHVTRGMAEECSLIIVLSYGI